MLRHFYLLLLFCLLSAPTFSQSHSVYFIGHSLCTEMMPQMISTLAEDAGVEYTYDYQLIWGACLSRSWDWHADSVDAGSIATDS